ncbi:MAG: hypothetical protein Q8P02_03525 [Candidatus Micrarchaeota archaeon]|nr:hypothetical protein [Candidatus Micrarchaeota archaeon]
MSFSLHNFVLRDIAQHVGNRSLEPDKLHALIAHSVGPADFEVNSHLEEEFSAEHPAYSELRNRLSHYVVLGEMSPSQMHLEMADYRRTHPEHYFSSAQSNFFGRIRNESSFFKLMALLERHREDLRGQNIHFSFHHQPETGLAYFRIHGAPPMRDSLNELSYRWQLPQKPPSVFSRLLGFLNRD